LHGALEAGLTDGLGGKLSLVLPSNFLNQWVWDSLLK